MDASHKRKLEESLRKSTRFLWSVGKGHNQETNYQWLWGQGLVFERGAYASVTEQLLDKPGIEKLVTDIIIPRVKKMFSEKDLADLRCCWKANRLPDMAFVRGFDWSDLCAFLELDAREYAYNKRNVPTGWSDFAKVWFKEIESLRKPSCRVRYPPLKSFNGEVLARTIKVFADHHNPRIKYEGMHNAIDALTACKSPKGKDYNFHFDVDYRHDGIRIQRKQGRGYRTLSTERDKMQRQAMLAEQTIKS